MTSALEQARAVADAVLYEGYVLYPYRASAPKNQVRWQWGVLMPPDAVAQDESERIACRTAVVVDGDATAVRATVRFLHVQQRSVEDADGRLGRPAGRRRHGVRAVGRGGRGRACRSTSPSTRA